METKNIVEVSRTEEPVYELQMLSGLEIDITELEERLELATLQLADCYGNAFGCGFHTGGCAGNVCFGNAFGCWADASGCAGNAGGADGNTTGNATGCNCDYTYYCGCDGDWVDV